MFIANVIRKRGVTVLVVHEHFANEQRWVDGDQLRLSVVQKDELCIDRELSRQLALAEEIMRDDDALLRKLASN